MTPKEKAIELVNKQLIILANAFFASLRSKNEMAKQCALICVDEILENIPNEVMSYKPFMMNNDYWQEVKQEINKL